MEAHLGVSARESEENTDEVSRATAAAEEYLICVNICDRKNMHKQTAVTSGSPQMSTQGLLGVLLHDFRKYFAYSQIIP